MKTPSERLLAQKALNGKLRRTESKDLLLQISKEKKRFEQIVHRRKEVVANEMRRNSPSISRLRTKKPLTAKQLRSKPGGVGGSMKVGSGDRRRSDDLMCHRKESEMGVLKLAYRVRASANQKPEVHNYEHYSGTRKGKIQQSMSMTSLVGSFGGGRHMGMTSMAANNSQRLSNNILDERENMKSRGNNGNRIRPTTAGARLNKALQYQTAQQDQARPSTSHSGTLRKDNELMRTIAEFNNTNMMKSLTVNSESLGRGGIPVRTIMVPPPRLPPGEAYPELVSEKTLAFLLFDCLSHPTQQLYNSLI